jgi:hypothetical protein
MLYVSFNADSTQMYVVLFLPFAGGFKADVMTHFATIRALHKDVFDKHVELETEYANIAADSPGVKV